MNGLAVSLKRVDDEALTSGVEVRQLESGEEGEWNRFVTSCEMGTFFHVAAWKVVVERALGHRCFFLTARRSNRVSGVLPLSWVRNRLFGDCLVSLPLAVYGGICAADEGSYLNLLNAARDLANKFGVKYLELRNQTEPYPISLPGRDLYITFTQDLTQGAAGLLQNLPRDTRYAVRKSQKAGLEWTDDLTLDEFYNIYAGNVHRLGTPVFPKSMFSLLRSEFPQQCRLFGVRKSGKAIAGVLTFYFKDEVMPYYGGSLPEYYKDYPNNFMYWNLIEQSCREGYRKFDFGRSKRGTGACKFKSSWSMQVTALPYRYYLVRAKEVPHWSPVDRTFQLPIAIWKQLPFGLTKVLGPKVIRWIPSV